MLGDIRRNTFALACAGAMALASAGGHAADPQRPAQLIDLSYDVDPSLACPEAVAFRSMLAERLGRDPHQDGAPLRVEVRARPTEQQGQQHGIDGTVRWSSAAEPAAAERHFSPKGHDCHELMATIAFVLAVQIKLADGGALEAPVSTDDASVKAPETLPSAPVTKPEASPPAAVEADPPSAPDKASEWILDVGIGPSLGVALAPRAVPLGRLLIAVQVGHAAVELAAEGSWPTTMYQERGGGFRHQLVLGSLAACAGHKGVQLCGLGKVGALRVKGIAVDKAESPTGLVALAGARAAYTLELGNHTALLAHGDALVLITPWTVAVNRSDIWSMPRFAGSVGIDLLLRFR